jgi:hypothetical protein
MRHLFFVDVSRPRNRNKNAPIGTFANRGVFVQFYRERETGLEPATFSLGS